MLKGLGQMASMMKQAGEMQARMREIQENLRKMKVEGCTGGGLVTIEMNGELQVTDCRIEKSVFVESDVEVLEDLIIGATNQALEKAKQMAATEMSKLTGGLDLSGMGNMLSKLTGG